MDNCGLAVRGRISRLADPSRKNSSLKRCGLIAGISLLFLLAGCPARVAHKAKGISVKVWRAAVNAYFDDTGVRPLESSKARAILSKTLGNSALFENVDVRGVWVDGAVLSYGYFIYKVDKKELLAAIANAPLDTTFQIPSDASCKEVTWKDCKDGMLTYKLGPQRNLPGWNLESVSDKRCYECLRVPWAHTLLIDGQTGTIYHSISEIRD